MRKSLWVMALIVLFVWATAGLADMNQQDKLTIDQLVAAYNAGGTLTEAEKSLLYENGIELGVFDLGIDEAGGPDAYGYSYIDSQEDDGPDFEWVDISTTGTAVSGLGDDGSDGPFDIGFNFDYYGAAYTQFWVNANGWISFTTPSGTTYTNYELPYASAPNNAIYAYWDDLHEQTAGEVYYLYDADSGALRVQFEDWNVRSVGTTITMDIQIAIFDDGSIVFYYNNFDEGWDFTSETIGIENSDGTIGLTVSHMEVPVDYPFAGLAIGFYPSEYDASVSGTITDAETEAPIEGALVSVGGGSDVTGVDGTYSITEAYSGTWTLTVEAQGYLDYVEENVVIEAGANVVDAAMTEAPPEPVLTEVDYFWLDILDDGTNLSLTDDSSIQITFADYGFPDFVYYGISYSSIFVTSNGWCSFLMGNGSRYYDELPSTNNPNASFFLLSDDLNPSETGSGNVWVGMEGGNFVVTYDNVHFYGSSDLFGPTMQLVLSPDGSAYYNYQVIDFTEEEYTGEHSIGFEDEAGERGGSIYYGTAFSYPADETSFRIGMPGGDLDGTVTDSDGGGALEDFTVEIWTQDMGSLIASTVTGVNGEYAFSNIAPGLYDVKAYGPGYRSSITEDVEIIRNESTTVNFELVAGTDPVMVTGWIMSADTPDTYVPGAVVQIPALGIFDVTEADGSFDLGEVTEGTYNFVVTHLPDGSLGYHGTTFNGVELTGDAVPLTLYMPEVLTPLDVIAEGFDEEIVLSWSDPANHALTIDQIENSINIRREIIERIYNSGSQEELAKVGELEAELFMFEHELALRNSDTELDNIDDFVGYRVKMIVEGNETILPGLVTGNSYTITDLANGILYGFEVAADYEYGEDYLVWSDMVQARPLPGGGEYEANEIEYEWVDISETGTLVDGLGDDGSSGPFQVGFDFPYYGSTYSQFWINANCWISFTTPSGNTYSNYELPHADAPNNCIYLYWDDMHEQTAGNVYYLYDADNGVLRVQWEDWNVRSVGTNLVMDAQMALYDDGRICFYYDNFDEGWDYTSETIGIENEDGTEGLTISYNTNPADYPYAQLALQIESRDRTFALLQGYVTDYATEEGVPGVAVDIIDSEGIHWFGETDEFGYYGAILDRNTGPYDVTFSKQGYIEVTETGVAVDPDPEIFENNLDAVMTPWGSIEGTVTFSDTEEPVDGAIVQVLDGDGNIVTATSTDEEGWFGFMQMFEDRTQTYNLHSYTNGYQEFTSEDLTWDVAGEQFIIESDIALLPIANDTPPTIMSWNGDYDNGVMVNMQQPGSYMEEEFIQYDDGEVVNAHSFYAEDNDANGWMGFRFFMEGPSIVAGGEMRLAVATDPWGAWPNGVNEPILMLLFGLDEAADMPEDAAMFTSDEVTASVEAPFVTFAPYLGVDGDFFIGAVHTVYGDDREGFCVDNAVDWDNVYLHRTVDNGWIHTSFSGDPLTRATILSFGGALNTLSLDDRNASRASSEPVHGLQIANARLEQPVWGIVPPIHAGRSDFCVNNTSELDEFLGYNVYTSTDGTNFAVNNTEMIEVDQYFAVYGSEFENQDVYLYATALVQDGENEVESDPTETETVVFNMPPAAPTNLVGVANHENHTIALEWDAPTENADGTDLVDLDGYVIYRDGEEVATVEENVTEYTDTVTGSGYYTYWVCAADEVPNESPASVAILERIGNAEYMTGFDPQELNDFESDGIWEHGEPTAGPGAAYSEPNVWGTLITSNEYGINQENFLTSTVVFPIVSTSAMVVYKHWLSYEANYDGYQLQVSTDGGTTWTLVEPMGGYPDRDCVGLNNEPAWSGASDGWQTVFYEIGDYNEQSIMIRFRHGTDSSVTGYFGVAIDDFQIFGTIEPAFGTLDGTVTDCDDEAVEDAVVHVVGTNYSATTDAGGYYNIPEVLVGTWDLLVTHDSYWPLTVEDVTITEGATTTEDIEDLEYPEGDPSSTTLELNVYIGQDDADSTGSIDFDLSSIGCGPLQWTADLDVIYIPWEDNATSSTGLPLVEGERTFELVDDNFASPTRGEAGPVRPAEELDELWDVLASYMSLETTLGENWLIGTVVTDEYMYVSSYNSGQFYTLDLEGNLLETVTVPGNMTNLADLSYDGEYIYANAYFGDHNIYRWQHNDLASAESIYTTPSNLGIGLAYDWDSGWFYFSEWQTIARWNENTNVSENVPLPAGVTDIMSMEYCPADPDGYTLWCFTQQNSGAIMYRTNPETGEASAAITLQAAIMAGGLTINDQYDGSNWSVQCVFQGTPDYVEIYEGYPAAPDWLTMDPMEGELEPNESSNIVVTADIRGELCPADPGVIQDQMTVEAEIEFGGPYWDGTVVTLAVNFVNDAAEHENTLPTAYALHQNFPNPFNPTTNLRFDLVEAQNVRLMVYNILGQEVARLVDGRMEAGFHEVHFDASMMSSGVYFYRIETEAFTSMKKMVLVK